MRYDNSYSTWDAAGEASGTRTAQPVSLLLLQSVTAVLMIKLTHSIRKLRRSMVELGDGSDEQSIHISIIEAEALWLQAKQSSATGMVMVPNHSEQEQVV
jgi:hypothetical protein